MFLVESFKLTNEDAAILNISTDTALPLHSGDGYAGILGVTHNLHCLVCSIQKKNYTTVCLEPNILFFRGVYDKQYILNTIIQTKR